METARQDRAPIWLQERVHRDWICRLLLSSMVKHVWGRLGSQEGNRDFSSVYLPTGRPSARLFAFTGGGAPWGRGKGVAGEVTRKSQVMQSLG